VYVRLRCRLPRTRTTRYHRSVLLRRHARRVWQVRNSTSKPPRAIYYKEIDASSGLDIFGDCFAALDERHIFELFRSLRHDHSAFTDDDDVLVQRFARANTARRRQFRYWQKHAQKLTAIETSAPIVVNAILLGPSQGTVETQVGPEVIVHTQAPQSQREKSIFTASEATNFDPKLDLSPLETQSVTSVATTARDLEGRPAVLPPPPPGASNDQDFVCPYCYMLCPSRHGKGRAWRSVILLSLEGRDANQTRNHILRDLSPYVCTYSLCTTPDRIYASRRDWLDHEELQHRIVWVCRFHPLLQFSTQNSLEHHLHNEVHEGMLGNGIRDYASISYSVTDDARLRCPICLERTSCISQFPAHLAHHMERIATFSLPKTLEDDEHASALSHQAVLDSGTGSSLDTADLSNASDDPSLKEADESYQHAPILAWLAPDSFSKPIGQLSRSIEATLWNSFLTGKDYKAWFVGDPLWRIYCCGSHRDRLVCYIPML
jgi:hypothetical protein